jgi:hypothetical protein
MSTVPFWSRYLNSLSGGQYSASAPIDGQMPNTFPFWKRYLASLLDISLRSQQLEDLPGVRLPRNKADSGIGEDPSGGSDDHGTQEGGDAVGVESSRESSVESGRTSPMSGKLDDESQGESPENGPGEVSVRNNIAERGSEGGSTAQMEGSPHWPYRLEVMKGQVGAAEDALRGAREAKDARRTVVKKDELDILHGQANAIAVRVSNLQREIAAELDGLGERISRVVDELNRLRQVPSGEEVGPTGGGHTTTDPAEVGPTEGKPGRAVGQRRGMDPFMAGILQRIRNAEQDLRTAQEVGDDFLVEVEQSELNDLHRLAAEHGIEVRHSPIDQGRTAS